MIELYYFIPRLIIINTLYVSPQNRHVVKQILLNNSLSNINKGNHNRDGGLDNWQRFLRFYFFVSFLVFAFDWEDISNTRDSVSSDFQTPWISSKSVVFSTLFSVFGNRMKHCLSCLIYYLQSHQTWLHVIWMKSYISVKWGNDLTVVFAIARSEVQMETGDEFYFDLIKNWSPSQERSH